MKCNHKNKGFTLMEMLIVVAIIAVLVAIAIPTFTTSLERSRQAVDAANARSLKALLATMVMDDQVDFSKGRGQNGINGIWVLVTRDTTIRPDGYAGHMDGTMFCGGDAGITIYGQTVQNWNNEVTPFRTMVENSIGILSSHSGGGKNGWDWYLVEYIYDKQSETHQCFVYSGTGNGSSGYGSIQNSLNTNPLAKYMEGRR